MSKIVVFRMLSQTGHINGSFSLANELKNHGYTVIYAQNKKFRKHIEINGFLFYEIPERDDIILFNKEDHKAGLEFLLLLLKKRLLRWRNYNTYKAAIQRKNYFKKIGLDLSPDLIILDSSLKIWGLQLFDLGIPFLTLQTFVSTLNIKPPRDSSHTPGNGVLDKFFTWVSWRMYYLRRIHYSSPRKLGQILAEKNESAKSQIDFKHQGPFGFYSVPEINTSPFQFDFPHQKYPFHYYYINSSLFKRKELRYDYLFHIQYGLLKERQEKKVFCSFGSMGWRYKNNLKLLRNLFQLFSTILTDIILIICVDDDELRTVFRSENISNIFVYKRVPQLTVLNDLADVMINHGGMNSIIECIYTETPMLVFPGSYLFDQVGNAARVKYHCIGEVGGVKDSLITLKNKINSLLGEEHYRHNILKLHTSISEGSNGKDIIDLISSYIKLFNTNNASDDRCYVAD